MSFNRSEADLENRLRLLESYRFTFGAACGLVVCAVILSFVIIVLLFVVPVADRVCALETAAGIAHPVPVDDFAALLCPEQRRKKQP